MTERILITGNKGFVGAAVFEHLGKQTYWETVQGIDLPEYDFTNNHDMKDIFETVKPTVILHIGAMAGLDQCMDNPTLAAHTNVFGTALLLKYAKEYNCKFIHTSTWAVEGVYSLS